MTNLDFVACKFCLKTIFKTFYAGKYFSFLSLYRQFTE